MAPKSSHSKDKSKDAAQSRSTPFTKLRFGSGPEPVPSPESEPLLSGDTDQSPKSEFHIKGKGKGKAPVVDADTPTKLNVKSKSKGKGKAAVHDETSFEDVAHTDADAEKLTAAFDETFEALKASGIGSLVIDRSEPEKQSPVKGRKRGLSAQDTAHNITTYQEFPRPSSPSASQKDGIDALSDTITNTMESLNLDNVSTAPTLVGSQSRHNIKRKALPASSSAMNLLEKENDPIESILWREPEPPKPKLPDPEDGNIGENGEKLKLKSTIAIPHCAKPMPRLGLSVYRLKGPTGADLVLHAIEKGVEYFDTSESNYLVIKNAIEKARFNINRADLFFSTKMMFPGTTVGATIELIEHHIQRADLYADDADGEYFDLFLIQTPNIGRERRLLMWDALEDCKARDLVRAIGVRNFGITHLEELKEHLTDKESGKITGSWPPACNMLELHPWYQQRKLVQYCKDNGIPVIASNPLVSHLKSADKTLLEIAKHYRVSPNQVLVRYALQKGWIALPRTADSGRKNDSVADVFGFTLNDVAMKWLDALEMGEKGSVYATATDGDSQ